MGLFNKSTSNVPRSRQSSIDSQATDTDPSASTSTLTSEAWPSQCSDASSYGDHPSPEQRAAPYPAKRSSVFKLRNRSNTASSTASSFLSIAPVMSRGDSSNRASQDFHPSSLPLLESSMSKRSVFTRGKRSKRLSGANPVSPAELPENEEVDSSGRMNSLLRKGRRGSSQPSGPPSNSFRNLKHRISSPFDFQHLTHTDRQQLPLLEQASENDIVVGFSAVRNSQTPKSDLYGIKADDLHFPNFSSENLLASPERTVSVLGFRSPPGSPEQNRAPRNSESPGQDCHWRTVRTSRSVESFSQPSISPRAHRHTQSVARPGLAPIDDIAEDYPTTQRFSPPSRTRSHRNSGVWDTFTPLSTTPENTLPTIADESDYFGHAVTTPDNSAIHQMSPAYSPGLEDVAEEPERFVSPRPAPPPPTQSTSPRSPYSDSYSPRSNRTPIARTISRTSPKPTQPRTVMTRPMSQMSDTLGSAITTRRNSVRKSSSYKRRSNTWRMIEESWEADVDYLYENAIEADCDFDWEHNSDEGGYTDRDRTPEQQDHERPATAISHREKTPSIASEEEPSQPRFFHGAFRGSLLIPSPNNVPELGSAISASTADTIQTPQDFFSSMVQQRMTYAEAEGLVLTPSLLVPQEYKEDSREEMYNNILADYEGSDRHFPILDANQSVTSSSRSSHIRSSKRSSYDSSLMSSGQGSGSGSWSSPIRRSASSSGSLPELVQSRRSRKDFNVVVDQLSEQVASFASFGEDEAEQTEDDDKTPPGRALQGRTFFSTDEEDQQSIESEVRGSLEFARQGSTRSTNAYHKHSSSEGAAKLLASPMAAPPELQAPPKSRKRAASSSTHVRAPRQPYNFSLFPTPPKHTPVNSPISSAPPSRGF